MVDCPRGGVTKVLAPHASGDASCKQPFRRVPTFNLRLRLHINLNLSLQTRATRRQTTARRVARAGWEEARTGREEEANMLAART